MLVEDDNNLREIYEARLAAEGYEIVTARDGEEALAVAVKERPDLVISDVMMPKISGFDMLDILRSTPETKNVKVIMMTALSQVEDKERATKLGADRYLVKSQVTLEDVAKVAREVLEGTPMAAAVPAPAADAVAQPEPIAEPAQTVTPPAEPAVATALPATEPAPAADPVAAPAMDPITMPSAPLPVDEPISAQQAEPTVADTTDTGVTDLSSTPPVAAPAAADEPTQETATEPEPEQDNDIVRSPAEVWAIDPIAEADAPVTDDATAKAPSVAEAEAKVDAVDTQSLVDEEAAIAKQIETMMDQPEPAVESTDTPAESSDVQPTTETPAAVAPANEPTESDTAAEKLPESEQTSKSDEAASTVGQKVIQPINDLSQPNGPDIHELAAKEAANEAAHVGGSVIAPDGEVSNPAVNPDDAPKNGGTDPNSLAL